MHYFGSLPRTVMMLRLDYFLNGLIQMRKKYRFMFRILKMKTWTSTKVTYILFIHSSKPKNRILYVYIITSYLFVDENGDPETGSTTALVDKGPPTSVIIPIYRRDCHEEVYAGSHTYPGKGVYLLKFDNTYSLWRSKTLYYRVYYTK